VNGVGDYRLVARNSATASANKIHDDEVARRYGFSGGLVPGVDVYAYMTHPPAATWGLAWLEHGALDARFVAPVYDGDDVTVVVGTPEPSPSGGRMTLEVRTGAGLTCAIGEARLPQPQVAGPAADHWADVAPATDPPDAAPEALVAGTALALAPHPARDEVLAAYLDDVGERLGLYTAEAVAHPGWLLRDANYVLSANVRLGPWIHVESHVQHHGLVRLGDTVTARATVTREWEHKGHRFVELDVGLVARGEASGATDDERVVAHVTHTAIYRPRTPAGD
jgi:acyl dehydratase